MKKWIGIWRILWGLCPICNSDAPEIDTCEYCKSKRKYLTFPDRLIELGFWLKVEFK